MLFRSYRIAIVGTTAVGKSSLFQALSKKLEVPHIELDSFFWGPNWTRTHSDLFRTKVSQALMGDCWVTDGNYSELRDIVALIGTIPIKISSQGDCKGKGI
ncbi:MAG: hypothetical protein EHM41_18300 [Chloroflexi bacterium]|nr:MAG: hypothetical protein EHM41_18300 [Chloroflexota bacterium]